MPLLFWIVFAFLLVWNIILSVFLYKSLKENKKLFGGTKKDELKSILGEHINRVGAVQVRLNDVVTTLSQVEEKSKKFISKVGVIRYNPFGDTGGDQSFVVALLDESDDGVVITSMHGRDRTRMYSKPINKGTSTEYELSEEEVIAIKKARELE